MDSETNIIIDLFSLITRPSLILLNVKDLFFKM